MNWGQFLRREWGAAIFVLTVVLGLVAVPIALYLGNKSAAPISVPIQVTASPASGASTAATASPARSP